MSASRNENVVLHRANAEQLSKDEIKFRIREALLYDWGETASKAANSFIDNNYDDLEQLLDDLVMSS